MPSAAAAATKEAIHAATTASSVVVCGMHSTEEIGLLSCSSASPSNPHGRIVPVPSVAFAQLHAATCSFVLMLHSVIILASDHLGVQVSRSLACFPRRVYSEEMPLMRGSTVMTPDSALNALARAVRTRLFPFSARSVGRAVASNVS